MASDAQGAHPGAHMHSGTVKGHAPADAITIPDAHLLFTGDFKRAGVDLVVSGDGHEIVLHDYFKGEKRAALASPDGAHLTGDIITALTGHTQFAQADGSPSVAQVIGHVTKLTGTATAIRNGVSIILNQGDNVNKGDVVASGSDSTLGITFIDGTVFGLASNAKMVLNEMIYDPNGSDNKSLISLVQGTISFVAGATAKHGDMKVDTPVATMGIRGTAVLVEIDFTVPATGGAPPAKFQVLVEPDGTTGSYILFDKTTLTPIATVNQAGAAWTVNGQGGVNFLSSAQISADAQKIITEVFAQKFSDLNNPNTKQATNFTDSVTQEFLTVKTASGEDVSVKVLTVNVADKPADTNKSTNPTSRDHIPGPPEVVTHDSATNELLLTTGSAAVDSASGTVAYADLNPGDVPTVSTRFTSFVYQNAGLTDVTATLTAAQLAAITAVEAPLVVTQDPTGINHGVASWTYNVADSAFDFLGAGEVLTLTYTARVDNNFALNNEFKEVTFTITITGTNDTPVITSSTQAAAITELLATHDSTTPDTATGTIKFTDADLTDMHAVTITDVTASGVTSGLAANATVLSWLSLGALTDSTDGHTGSRNWTFSAQDKSFDYLAVGETVTLTYTVQVDDHHGGVVTQQVAITVTGTNDTPVITSGTQAGTIEEALDTHDSPAPDTATGAVTFTDLDLSDTHTVTITGMVPGGTTTGLDSAAAQGWLTLGALTDATNGVTGSKAWTFSAADHYFDYLAEGEHLTLTYTVEVNDLHGGVVDQTVTITVNGHNDAPVAHADSDTGHIVEAGNNVDDTVYVGIDTTTGNVLSNDTDLDLSDSHSVVGVVKGTVTGTLSGGVGVSVTGLYGSLLLNPDGTWTYTLDNNNPATNALAQGVHVTDVFSYTDADNHGGTSTTTLTIDITGTNDAPVGANDAPVASADVNSGQPVVEMGVNPGNTAFDGNSSATGNVLTNDVDVDTGDTKAVQGVASGTPGGVLTAHVGETVAGTYGSVTIGSDGTWIYTLDNTSAATQALAQDQHVTDVFTYTMRDAAGATSSATLTIDITGTNDAPVAVADTAAVTVTEAGVADGGNTAFANTPSASGNVISNDTDIDTGHTLTVAAVAGVTGNVGTSVTGTYGSVIIHTDGTYTYTLDDTTGSAADQLAQGAHVTDVFTYTTTDEHGATSTSTLTINIAGTNDAPVAVADTAAVTVTEAGVADGGNTAFANTSTASGNVLANDTDIDNGHTLTVTAVGGVAGNVGTTVTGTYGSVTIHIDGTYTYTLDDTLGSAADQLAQGAHVIDVFTYTTTDEHGATSSSTLTINITGTNDAPVAVADIAAVTVTEAGVADGGNTAFANTPSASGNVISNDTDIDAGHVLTVAAVGGDAGNVGTTVTGTYGSVIIHADGSYSYTLDDTLGSAADQLAQGDHVTDVFAYTTTDEHGATSSSTLTINITGTNDAPVVASALTDTANEGDASFTHNLLAGASDVDHGDTATLTVGNLHYAIDGGASSTTAPAGISLGADGYTLTVDPGNPAFDHLANGQQSIITVSYDVTDAHGAKVAQTETITITGTNDGPTLSHTVSEAVNFHDGVANFSNFTGPVVSPDGQSLRLTDGGGSEAASWFDNTKVSVGNFAASFDYQAAGSGDGLAFVLQNSSAGIHALGDSGSALGYGHYNSANAISPSVAIELNIYDFFSPHVAGTALAVNGSYGSYTSTAPVNFWSTGDTVHVALAYSGGTLTETLTDLVTHASYSTSYSVDLASIVGGSTAWVGFSAGTGGATATQTVSNFSISNLYQVAEDSSVAITGLAVGDVDAGAAGTEQVTLNVAHGALALATTAGLTGDIIGTDGSLTISGTLAAVNAALATVTYTPSQNYNGAETLHFTATDQGGSGLSASTDVAISITPVNDAPTASAPSMHYSATAGSDLDLHNTGLSVSDVDGGNGIETATLSAGQGIITIAAGNSGVTNIAGNGTGSVSFSGTVAQINALLNTSTGTVVYNDNAGSSAATVALTLTVHDNGNTGGGDLSASASATIDVAASGQASGIQLLGSQFLGGAGDQAATDVTYANGHLYLTYNGPITQTASDQSTIATFTTDANGATQGFSDLWTKGFFSGVTADASNIYAVGGSHPGAGLTHDGSGGEEDKSILVGFNADGTAGNNPAPAIGYAADNFFGYRGTEMFEDVLATTQGGNTVLYAVGFGQPQSYGAYVIAEYSSNGTLLHTATDSAPYGSFSDARDAVEFNGAVWAVGDSFTSGVDSTNVATVWTASYDLSSVTAHKDSTETAGAGFAGAAVLGNALYAVGHVVSNGGDYLVAKYNTDGSVAWSHSFGGSGADTLNAAVALNGHLYVVGSTESGGNTDGVLMEINTTDGSVVSTTTYGGTLYDSFNSITTDGHNLYVAGESKSFTNGGNGAGQDDAVLLTYSPSPVIAGDLAVVAVKGGSVQLSGLDTALTTADLQAIDAGFTPGQLTFTVTATSHGHLATSANGAAITSFTQAQLNSGSIYFVADTLNADNTLYTGQGGFTVSLSDGAAGRPATTATVGVYIVDAQFKVLASGGYDFDQDNSIAKMGSGIVVPDETDPGHSFQIVNAAQGADFIFAGSGFTYGANNVLTGGIITSIQEVTHDPSHSPLATFDLNVSAVSWYGATVAAAGGDQSLIEALTAPWTFNFIGNNGADSFGSADNNDVFTGRAGNDTFDGQFGYDRANYGSATGSIGVQLAAGIVNGDGSVGTDSLKSIELVTGSNYADTYNAVGFSSSSQNAGSAVTANVLGLFNEFEGRGGDDLIVGNGATRISYQHATSGVTVTFNNANPTNSWPSTSSGASGIATGDASTGTDHFAGVNSVRGSNFDDVFHGSNNPSGTGENFEGMGGNDLIDGGLGFDRAIYNSAHDGVGITVNLAAGTVTGGPDTGSDTLLSVEGVWGTTFADIYDATGFTASSLNAGSSGVNGAGAAFNEFEGDAGNDQITGNGNTRVAYYHSTAGVVVTLGSNGSGVADGNATVGHDTFISGVNQVRGSEFNDIITGNGGNNVLEGQGGNDVLIANGGNDTMIGGTGSDIYVFKAGVFDGNTPASNNDTISDFNHVDGDKIDLRSISSIHNISDVLAHATQVGSNTLIDFNYLNPTGDPTSLTLLNVTLGNLTASDFIFASSFGDSVAVTVQTPDGYDFGTLYNDLAAGNAHQSVNDANHIFVVSAGKTFELTGSFTYSGNDPFHGTATGTVTGIDILNTTDPTQVTQDHVLVNTNGWNINVATFFSDITSYAADHNGSGLALLNGIFNSATYSVVGSAGFADNNSKPHDGADTFFGGDHADIFNGRPGPFGGFDPGSDTVDYSHATSAVSVDLSTGSTSGTAAAGDVFISIENLRGTNFDDTLVGDGNNNVLEGGLGNNTLDGGGGSNTASYEHATAAVTVDLSLASPQNTIGAGTDTLINIQGIRGSNYDDTLKGSGDSVLEGGAGNDHLIGQQGSVWASYGHASGGVTVDLSQGTATGAAGNDTLTNIANVDGSNFADTITGDSGDNQFWGNGGRDTFVFNENAGHVGHDTIEDFMSGQDHIQLDYAAFDPNDASSFSNWFNSHVSIVNNLVTNTPSDFLIDLDPAHPGQDTIRLQNASYGGLHASDFILHPSGGA